MSGEGAGDRRDQRVRDGNRQGRRENRLPRQRSRARSRPTTRRPAGPGGTARRRAACCSPSSATKACTCSSSSAPGSTPACSSGSPSGCGGRGSTGATTLRSVRSAADVGSDGDEETVRAVDRPSDARRAGGAAAGSPGPRGGRCGWTVGPRARWLRAWSPPATPSARAGASTARCGATSRVRAAAARHCWRTSATGRAPRRRWLVVTCARVGGRRGRPAARSPSRNAGDLDAAILDSWCPGPARRPHPRGRDPPRRPLEGHRQYAYDRLAGYGAFAHLRSSEVLRRVDQLLEPGRSVRPAAGFRSSARHERRGAGVRRRHQPPGAARSSPRPRGRGDRGRRLQQAGRAGARAGSRRRRLGPSSPARQMRRAERDRAMADWLVACEVELVVLAGTCSCCRAISYRGSRSG